MQLKLFQLILQIAFCNSIFTTKIVVIILKEGTTYTDVTRTMTKAFGIIISILCLIPGQRKEKSSNEQGLNRANDQSVEKTKIIKMFLLVWAKSFLIFVPDECRNDLQCRS